MFFEILSIYTLPELIVPVALLDTFTLIEAESDSTLTSKTFPTTIPLADLTCQTTINKSTFTENCT